MIKEKPPKFKKMRRYCSDRSWLYRITTKQRQQQIAQKRRQKILNQTRWEQIEELCLLSCHNGLVLYHYLDFENSDEEYRAMNQDEDEDTQSTQSSDCEGCDGCVDCLWGHPSTHCGCANSICTCIWD